MVRQVEVLVARDAAADEDNMLVGEELARLPLQPLINHWKRAACSVAERCRRLLQEAVCPAAAPNGFGDFGLSRDELLVCADVRLASTLAVPAAHGEILVQVFYLPNSRRTGAGQTHRPTD